MSENIISPEVIVNGAPQTMQQKDMAKVATKDKVIKIAVKCAVYLFLSVMALIVIFPFYFMLVSSLKSANLFHNEKNPSMFPKSSWARTEYTDSSHKTDPKDLRVINAPSAGYTYYFASASDDGDIYVSLVGKTRDTIVTTDKFDEAAKFTLEDGSKNDTFKLRVSGVASTYVNIIDFGGMPALIIQQDEATEWKWDEELQMLYVPCTDAAGDVKKCTLSLNDDKLLEIVELSSDIKSPIQPLTEKLTSFVEFRNYADVFELKDLALGRLFLNTVYVGIVSTILSLIITVLSAFAFARLEFKGKNALFGAMLATMMIPGELFTITNYLTVSDLGWIDTYTVLIVPFLVSVFYIYLLRQNFMQIPNELYLAAKVDGTTDLKYLWKVMIPLALPSLISITILKMMGAWNSYMWPNLVIHSKDHNLITTGLRGAHFTAADGTLPDTPLQMAAVALVSLPLFLVFIFLRKYIMKGVSRSGIKG